MTRGGIALPSLTGSSCCVRESGIWAAIRGASKCLRGFTQSNRSSTTSAMPTCCWRRIRMLVRSAAGSVCWSKVTTAGIVNTAALMLNKLGGRRSRTKRMDIPFRPRVEKVPRLADVTPHFSRHTAAVWMADGGVPKLQISQFLGHTNTKITESGYARSSPDFPRHAAVALNI